MHVAMQEPQAVLQVYDWLSACKQSTSQAKTKRARGHGLFPTDTNALFSDVYCLLMFVIQPARKYLCKFGLSNDCLFG